MYHKLQRYLKCDSEDYEVSAKYCTEISDCYDFDA